MSAKGLQGTGELSCLTPTDEESTLYYREETVGTSH